MSKHSNALALLEIARSPFQAHPQRLLFDPDCFSLLPERSASPEKQDGFACLISITDGLDLHPMKVEICRAWIEGFGTPLTQAKILRQSALLESKKSWQYKACSDSISHS